MARPGHHEGVLDADAPVPDLLQHELFVAVPLTAELAELDHAAYVASPEVVRVHSDGRWPVDGFTLADDLALVARHQDDHRARRAFTFLLLTPDHSEALGCVYLNPLREFLERVGAEPAGPEPAAMVTFWLRQDHAELADAVVSAVQGWLRDDWPLARWLYRVLPGERSSRRALERLGLPRVELRLPGDPRPYLWYDGARTA